MVSRQPHKLETVGSNPTLAIEVEVVWCRVQPVRKPHPTVPSLYSKEWGLFALPGQASSGTTRTYSPAISTDKETNWDG